MFGNDIKKMAEDFLNLGDVKIKKIKFQKSKDRNDIKGTGINKIIVSDAFAYRKNKKEDHGTPQDMKLIKQFYH